MTSMKRPRFRSHTGGDPVLFRRLEIRKNVDSLCASAATCDWDGSERGGNRSREKQMTGPGGNEQSETGIARAIDRVLARGKAAGERRDDSRGGA
jgi:hypothetical protein